MAEENKERHDILETWENLDHKFEVGSRNKETARKRLRLVVEFLGCSHIEDIDEDVDLIDVLREKLQNYKQPLGKHKGDGLSVSLLHGV